MYRELIQVRKHNDVYGVILADSAILKELSEYFKFRVPGYQFTPSYRNKIWDGYIRLFNSLTCQIYLGLTPYLEKFAKDREYDIVFEDALKSCETQIEDSFLQDFLTKQKIPYDIRDYQYAAIKHAVTKGRALLLSPTASGKSLIIYTLAKWFDSENILIVVPTIGLVTQMLSDFKEYGMKDADNHCHLIYEGQSKTSKKRITISTWQSIYKQPKEWFEKFTVVIGDEAHQYKAESIKGIMEKMIKCPYRFGTTGTLDGTQTNKLVLEGLFGPVFTVTTSKKLMDEGYIAQLKIECILLQYSDEEAKLVKKMKYNQEIAYILQHEKRNAFITNLAIALKGNTLLLFQYVEKHGKILHQLIEKKAAKKRKVFYVYGGTDAETREQIRKVVEKEKDAIIVASVGVFSTGINIKNLENIIFVAPSKSRIRTLQSIGRGLRIGRADKATLYDIVDDLRHKRTVNYALKHFIERAKIYDAEKFDYKVHNVDFGRKNTK